RDPAVDDAALLGGERSTAATEETPTTDETAPQDLVVTSGGVTTRSGLPVKSAYPDDADDVVFEADYVSRADENSPIVATGDVRAYFGARFLRADRLVYDPQADVVIAEGDVAITDENDETTFAGRVQLSGDLRDGVAENFSALLSEQARLAADSAVRTQNAKTRLTKAVYTACSVCKDNGGAKTPTWRIKALRVVRDEERKVVRFRHAFFEIKGVPVLYTPLIQAPDPTVERQSGFLTPLIGASSRLGFTFELPYYFAISNTQDATFFPRYTSNDGVLWQTEYRRRFDSGRHIVSGGVIDFEPEGSEDADAPEIRWNVFAKGFQDVTPNLRFGYDVERVSDDNFLRRYDVRRRGELRNEIDTTQTNRLRSNAFLQWNLDGFDVRADSFVFQNLRTLTVCDSDAGQRQLVTSANCSGFASELGVPLAETSVNVAVNDVTPFVLPLIDLRKEGPDFFGGRTQFNANFASLQRKSGVDSRRLSGSAYWERERITRGGHRLKAFAELRGDLYRFEDLDEGTESVAGVANDDNSFEARIAPTAGVEWSYPLAGSIPGGRLFIEPRAQLVASLNDRNPLAIINEDSQNVEFDYVGLFDFDKSTGYDSIEDGQRANVGLAMSATFDNGLEIDGSVGQQFRLQETAAFTPQADPGESVVAFPTGLGEERSDYVGSLNVNFRGRVGLENRFRLDDDGGGLRRVESRAFMSLWRLRTSANYVLLREEGLGDEFAEREELTGRGVFQVTDHWSAGFGWRQDLNSNQVIRQDFSIGYRDDCSLFEVTFRRDRTRDVGLNVDNAFLFRFTLTSLVD
ncbi:MAG: LPS-assembly protein LptD, partial [Parvularculaceae bacterium]